MPALALATSDSYDSNRMGWFVRLIASLTIAITVLWVDPFQLNDSQATDFSLIFHRLLAPAYPVGAYNPAPAKDRIAVAMVSDATLEVLHQQWPLPYETWARILGKILDSRPAAVFVDILFLRPPAEGDAIAEGRSRALTQVVDRYAMAGVPLIVADANADGRSVANDVRRTMGPAVHTADISAAGGGGNMYALGRAGGGSSMQLAPAAALFAALCQEGDASFCPPRGLREIDPARSLYIDWAIADDAPDRPLALRAASHLWHVIRAPVSDQTRMPAHTIVPVGRLFRPALATEASARSLFEDRVVFVGAALTGLADSVESPALGQVSGVFVHAMAFDNLLTYGKHHKFVPAAAFGAHVLAAATLLLVLLASELRYTRYLDHWYVHVGIALILIAASLGIYVWLGVAPVNVFAVFLLAHVAYQATKWLPTLGRLFARVAPHLMKEV